MAEPVQRDGKWYGRVKNAAGLWRNVILAEARTKTQARELQDALALRSRRQRDGLEPMPTDRAFTVGALLRWWLNTYVAGKPWAGREEDRFRLYFESTDFVRLPLVALTAGRLELFLQHWSQKGLGPASVNKLRDGADSVQPRSSRRPGAWPESRVGHEAAQGSERAPAFLEPREVDLKPLLLTVRPSHNNHTTKAPREHPLPIAVPLGPYPKAPLVSSKG